MRERLNPILKVVCLGLATVLVLQLSRLALRSDPLSELSIMAISSSSPSVESQASKKGTNAVRAADAGRKGPDVPPAVQARIDRIIQSEILGAVMRPLPMALLGIAGQDVFLRAPNGQTGLIREGEELGGVKLLRIGTNRVLIEHEQQQKELMLFSGFGGETLLQKGKTNSNAP